MVCMNVRPYEMLSKQSRVYQISADEKAVAQSKTDLFASPTTIVSGHSVI